MTTQDFIQLVSGKNNIYEPFDEAAVKEVAHLVSGSLIFRLYESLVSIDFSMDEITEHLEMLIETDNHVGLLYFVFMLADASNEELPNQFIELTMNHTTVPYLASSLIEDWLDFHGDYGT